MTRAPAMTVVATAGHVDHGKSTLVRALTGMEPDRWAEERRRGMTIDLGYAWTRLFEDGPLLAFVDVPGHERFLGNMLAGLGPAPAVLFVVAADGGWSAQSSEHLAAIDALQLRHGLLAVTRSDLADPGPALAQARERLAHSSLGAVEAIPVSPVTGFGLADLREALRRLAFTLPEADPGARVRLWVDRSFTIAGRGTVVTGTLTAGTLRIGDPLATPTGIVPIRGLHCLGEPADEVRAPARVAVNLRRPTPQQVGRGSALLTPGGWPSTAVIDVRVSASPGHWPPEAHLHVGTAAVPARIRPLADDLVRLTLARPLPLQVGDRAILRDPGGVGLLGGAEVLDPDPPPLRRRGAATHRAVDLQGGSDAAATVRRRGAIRRDELTGLGFAAADVPGAVGVGDWWVAEPTWRGWQDTLVQAARERARVDPMHPSLPGDQARDLLALPDVALLPPLVQAAGLAVDQGRIHEFETRPVLDEAAESFLAAWERRWRTDGFVAPEAEDLATAGFSRNAQAAAARLGRVFRLPGDVLLPPQAPAQAMRLLTALPQPFTTSQARQALGTTRRVAVPLLEELDRRGWTHRVDGSLRTVR